MQYHTSGLLSPIGHGNASHFHFFKAVASSRQNTAPLLQHVTQTNKQKLSSLEHGPQMPQEEQIQTLSWKNNPWLNHGRNPEGCTSTADSWRDYQRDWGYFAEASSPITPGRFDATAGQKKMLHLSFSHKQASILQLGWNTIYRSSMCDFCWVMNRDQLLTFRDRALVQIFTGGLS